MRPSKNTQGNHASRRLQVATIAVLVGLTGCATSRSGSATSETPAPPPEPAAQPAPVPTPQPAVAEAPAIAVKTKSIYFDFDSSDLSPIGQESLASLGGLLASYPELHVRIEGNCDERGTPEYNIALGNRRAESARGYLMQMGARTDQITTVSYGKQRPRAKGHHEAAWAQNRRDDLIPDRDSLPGKPVAGNP
jgi:peptidoglycan-associated lipoprotein